MLRSFVIRICRALVILLHGLNEHKYNVHPGLKVGIASLEFSEFYSYMSFSISLTEIHCLLVS